MLDGVVQAQDTAEKLGTNNIIVIVYPEEIRRPIVTPEQVEHLALEITLSALILTNFWKDHQEITAEQLFSQLRERVEKKEKVVSLGLVIKVLHESIIIVSEIIRSLSGIEVDKALT